MYFWSYSLVHAQYLLNQIFGKLPTAYISTMKLKIVSGRQRLIENDFWVQIWTQLDACHMIVAEFFFFFHERKQFQIKIVNEAAEQKNASTKHGKLFTFSCEVSSGVYKSW